MVEKSGSEAIRHVVQLPGGFVSGAIYPFQALTVLWQTPQLWGYVVFPVLVNFVIGAVLYVSLLIPGWQVIAIWSAGLPDWISQWIAGLPTWAAHLLLWLPTVADVLAVAMEWLLAIVLFILLGLLLVQFGAVLGAPWYGNLAEQIERLRVGQLPTGEANFSRALQDIGRAITFQLKKLLLGIAIGIPILLLNFVPIPVVSNTIASVAGIALASLLVGLDFLDAPLERRRLSFRAKLGIFGRTLPNSASFSWVCLILISIPLLNLLVVPICVAAGTLFCCDRVLPNLPMHQSPIRPAINQVSTPNS